MKKQNLQLIVVNDSQPEDENRVVRAELNLEQWSGLFAPSQARGRKTEIRVLEQIETLANGDTLKRSLAIEPSVELGTLTAKDQRVLYALFVNWVEQGKPLTN